MNGENIVKAMNTWAVTAVHYTVGVLDWTEEKLKSMDRKETKLIAMNRVLHPKADIDRLYLEGKYGGQDTNSVEVDKKDDSCLTI